MVNADKIFCDYLKRKDLKNTPERMIIMQEIIKIDNHFDAEAILDHFKKVDIKISRASVYRTLDLLISCGLVRKVNFNNSSYQYESIINKDKHDHFICVKCGKIIEFYDEELKNIHLRLKNKYKMEISDYIHHIYGKCAECE